MHTVTSIGRYLGLAEIAIRSRLRDDRGEGVISMAIAVLIIATIGAAMWAIFNGAANDLGNRATTQVNQVGN